MSEQHIIEDDINPEELLRKSKDLFKKSRSLLEDAVKSLDKMKDKNLVLKNIRKAS